MIISGENTVVTLKDSTGTGSITTAGNIAIVTDGATLKVESGKYTSTGDIPFWAGGKDYAGNIEIGSATSGPEITGQEFAVGFGKNSKVTVNNGTLTAKDNAVIGNNGSAGFYENGEVVINGGTFNGEIQTNGYTGCGIYVAQNAKVTVNDGTFNIDGVGICARAGEVNIKGGQFKSTTTRAGWVGDKKTQISANGVYYDGAAKYPGLKQGAKLNITGGTFENTADNSIPAAVITQPAGVDFSIEINNAAQWSEPLL